MIADPGQWWARTAVLLLWQSPQPWHHLRPVQQEQLLPDTDLSARWSMSDVHLGQVSNWDRHAERVLPHQSSPGFYPRPTAASGNVNYILHSSLNICSRISVFSKTSLMMVQDPFVHVCAVQIIVIILMMTWRILRMKYLMGLIEILRLQLVLR